MKAHLLHRDRDFEPDSNIPANAADLSQDLALTPVLEAMAGGDPFVLEVSRRAILASLTDPEAIVYRQRVLADCVAEPDLVREIYQIAAAAVASERRVFGPLRRYPTGTLHRSVEVLELFVPLLRRLRELAQESRGRVRSEGLTEFFGMLVQELDDQFFESVAEHLQRLRFRDGVLMSAQLGEGNKGVTHLLRRPASSKQSWKERLGIDSRVAYSFDVPARDEAGARALAELTDQGINLVANAVAQSAEHILSFFSMLRTELGFYVGCLNLGDQLVLKGAPVCTPVPLPAGAPALTCRGLYDPGLALRLDQPVVGTDVDAEGKSLVVITGANSGGKSTFLRSVGLAQLLMQSGMFVAAQSFRADLARGVFTHFIREEDATMRSGRLDEELGRMRAIVEAITPPCLVLFNESLASTNEREGSEIARQVVRALMESGVKVFIVTHFFDLASSLQELEAGQALFLRAEREADGRRTFKLVEGGPLPTSYGKDLYDRLGGWTDSPRPDPCAGAGQD